MEQVDELEVFNCGLGEGIRIGNKYAWTLWNEETGEVPDIHEKCVGLWMHKRKTYTGMHAECFMREWVGDMDDTCLVSFNDGRDLRSPLKPDFWMRVPKPGDY